MYYIACDEEGIYRWSKGYGGHIDYHYLGKYSDPESVMKALQVVFELGKAERSREIKAVLGIG